LKKRFAALLALLTLLAATALPAGAWEIWAYPPRKYRTFQEYLDFYQTQEDEGTKALVEYLEQRLAEGVLETFDADAYFKENIEGDGPGVTKGNWLGWNDDWHDEKGTYDQEWFQAEMLDLYLTKEYRAMREMEDARQKEVRFQTWTQNHPEIYAGFNPYAWFDGYYGTGGSVLETYMRNWSLDDESFKKTMFMEWADRSDTAFFNGYCVTVNGTPIQFQLYRDAEENPAGPKAENGRILIPLRAAAEALGLTVEWRPETNEVTCSDEETTVTFTLGSTEYSGGTLDVAPYAENGITYLPLRALGETLGCGVTWYQDFATAALTTEK
jgi:hypothetical protein